MGDAARKAFVVGHPIAHSRSPLIHGHWLREYGIDGRYEKIDVAPQALAGFIGSLAANGFAGGNVTIPHKEAVFALADRVDEAAELIGAANTLWFDEGGLHAGNTDAYGFSADLDSRVTRWRQAGSALVLGAGGAARAIVYALVQAGIADIRIVNRSVQRGQELAKRFGASISAHPIEAVDDLSGDVGLVVNTTSVGMNGKGGSLVSVDLLPDRAIVVDIVYTPLATPLLEAASVRGLETVDGLGMLLHQAVPGFQRWFGIRPAVTEALRARVVADIEGRT